MDASASKSPEAKENVSPAKAMASKRMRYGRAVSRFRGFDDFSVDSLPSVPAVSEDPVDDEMPDAGAEPIDSEDQTAQDIQRLEIGSQARGKKRTQNESSIDNLLPAAASMKRRRVENGGKVNPRPATRPLPEATQPRKRIFKKTAIQQQDFDVEDDLEEAERRNEERAEQDDRVEPLTAEEIAEVQELLQFEEMAVQPSRKAAQRNQRDSDRWDPRWNGRKNFKKFRKQGGRPQPLRGMKATIRLEEARKKDILLGSVPWGNPVNNDESGKVGRTYDSDGNDDSQFRRSNRTGNNRDGAPMRRLADISDSEFSDHDTGDISMDLDVLPARHRRRQTQNQSQQSELLASQSTLTSGTSRATGPAASRKRPASKTSSGRSPPPAKRIATAANSVRSSRVLDDDGSGDSEDEFRFKSRRKR
jgi:nibrin